MREREEGGREGRSEGGVVLFFTGGGKRECTLSVVIMNRHFDCSSCY